VLIATDSKIIFDVCKSFGADAMMTSSRIVCGSDRVAAAARKFKKFKPAIVVNIQGDEPLMPRAAIDATVRALLCDKKAVVATPITPFLSAADVASPNFVKAIGDREGYALYFSRSVIPYPREQVKRYWKHLGLYAFRADFLQRYVKLLATPLEKAEKLEQLRILEHGYQIRLVPGNFQTMEVNTLEEFERARKMIMKKA
jgi:3-deoxy-manno-octulosonate cytidylyltransferase (CMP-KDO synthetase)